MPATDNIHYRTFRPDELTAPAVNSPLNEAALRQFTLHRLMAYGVEPGDALRLLELISAGYPWKQSCKALTQQVLDQLCEKEFPARENAAAGLKLRASALLRMSQVMDLDNSDERRSTYTEAARLYTAARRADPRYRKIQINTKGGTVSGWLVTPGGQENGPLALVHGGVDGWSMDWEGLVHALVDEGLRVCVIDGPGQGETRFDHNHFFTPGWIDDYEGICDFLLKTAKGLPVVAVGNSMAAGLLMLVQSKYRIFSALCSNGPVLSMSGLLERGSFAQKMSTFCGSENVSASLVTDVFTAMDLSPDRIDVRCPYLLLQGDDDPIVPVSDGDALLSWVAAEDKRMILFSGGEHVINRYPADKYHVVRTWLRKQTNNLINKRTEQAAI